MVLGTKNTTEQYHCSHTNNCTSMVGCHHRHQGKKIPESVCNKNQSRKDIQRGSIF